MIDSKQQQSPELTSLNEKLLNAVNQGQVLAFRIKEKLCNIYSFPESLDKNPSQPKGYPEPTEPLEPTLVTELTRNVNNSEELAKQLEDIYNHLSYII